MLAERRAEVADVVRRIAEPWNDVLDGHPPKVLVVDRDEGVPGAVVLVLRAVRDIVDRGDGGVTLVKTIENLLAVWRSILDDGVEFVRVLEATLVAGEPGFLLVVGPLDGVKGSHRQRLCAC